jgi:hypothetical protein
MHNENFNNKNFNNEYFNNEYFNNDQFNIFYTALSNKIKNLNNANKWQLHTESKDGIPKNRSVNKFLSLNKPVSQEIGRKPSGLWTSGLYNSCVNKSWLNLHKEEYPEFMNPSDYNFYIFKFDNSKILQIKTKSDFNSFHIQYADYNGLIDWNNVSKHYSGINITPYRNNSLNVPWYGTWDCGSQCVWNKDAIQECVQLDIADILPLLEIYNSNGNRGNITPMNSKQRNSTPRNSTPRNSTPGNSKQVNLKNGK